MSVQSGVTQSSPSSHMTHSYRQSDHGPQYYDLSGSSQWNSNSVNITNNNFRTPTNSKAFSKYKQYSKSFKKQTNAKPKDSIQYPLYNQYVSANNNTNYKLSQNLSEYNICCGTFTYCFMLITYGILMILSWKLQSQSITKNPSTNEHLYFRLQCIPTWFFFVAKTLSIIIIICPCCNKTAGIAKTYHLQMLINHPNNNKEDNLSRQNKFKTLCQRQFIHIMLALNLVFGQFFLNVALYYMSASIWTIFLSLIILHVSAFKFFLIESSIIVFND